MAITNGYAKFMNYAKLWERIRIQNEQGIWTKRDKKLLTQFKANTPDDSAGKP
jgi:hypothetical protein